jgi:hypothetical protein
MARLIQQLRYPDDSDELRRLIELLLRDAFDPYEVETRLDDEGALIVTFPEHWDRSRKQSQYRS